MKKLSYVALTALLVTTLGISKVSAFADAGGGTVTVCSGSPDICKASFKTDDGRTWTVDSVKSKDSSAISIVY